MNCLNILWWKQSQLLWGHKRQFSLRVYVCTCVVVRGVREVVRGLSVDREEAFLEKIILVIIHKSWDKKKKVGFLCCFVFSHIQLLNQDLETVLILKISFFLHQGENRFSLIIQRALFNLVSTYILSSAFHCHVLFGHIKLLIYTLITFGLTRNLSLLFIGNYPEFSFSQYCFVGNILS